MLSLAHTDSNKIWPNQFNYSRSLKLTLFILVFQTPSSVWRTNLESCVQVHHSYYVHIKRGLVCSPQLADILTVLHILSTARVYMFQNSYWHRITESYLCSLQNKNHGWTHFCICCRLCCSCIKDSCPTEKCICCFERQSRGTVKIVYFVDFTQGFT